MASECGLDFGWCLGKFVKVVFREDPNAPEAEVRKGLLAGFDDDFIQLRTHKNIYLISRKHIISLKIFVGGGNEHQEQDQTGP